MTKPWLSLSIVVGLVFMLATPVLAGFQEGVDAYERGDYDTALKEFRPLAERQGSSPMVPGDHERARPECTAGLCPGL